MLIYKKLNLDLEKQNVISFVGSGGKSTSINVLAKELKDMGKKVLVTTTTVIFHPQHKDNDNFILEELPNDYVPQGGTITVYGKSMDDEKIRGISIDELEEIYKREIFNIILIEADGARRKPIKAPAEHEPMVASFTTMTIGVIGLDCLGKPLDEDNVHRLEILKELLDVGYPHKINGDDIVKLALHKDGLFKGGYGEKVMILNKANGEDRVLAGKRIRKELYDKGFKTTFITDVQSSKIY